MKNDKKNDDSRIDFVFPIEYSKWEEKKTRTERVNEYYQNTKYLNMEQVTIGMAGAGRATELHIMALKRFLGVPVRLKTIVARRKEQLEEAQRLYGFEQISYSFDDMIQRP